MEAIKYSTKSYWLPKRHDSTVTKTVLIKLKVSCTLGREDEEEEDVNGSKYNSKLKEAGKKRNVLIMEIVVIWVRRRRHRILTCREKRSRCRYNIKLGNSCVFWKKTLQITTKQMSKQKPNRKKNTKSPHLAVFMRWYLDLILVLYIIYNKGGWECLLIFTIQQM